MNQKSWLSLEDYVLEHADAKDLRVSVFTGPVLRADDPSYRDIRLPREYWKVVVLVNSDTGELSATGYMLSQAKMIRRMEEFVYGKFRTYQVSIEQIEQTTGLTFGELSRHDPMAGGEIAELVGGRGSRLIEGPADMVFSAPSKKKTRLVRRGPKVPIA